MKIIKSLKYAIEAIKVYTQIKSIYSLEKECDNFCVDSYTAHRYGINRGDLLSGLIECIYQKGKKDALNKLKDNAQKLNRPKTTSSLI